MILLKTFIIAFSVFTFLSAILMLTRNPKLTKIVITLMIIGSILLDFGALIIGFIPALIMIIIGLALIQIGIAIYQKKTFGKVVLMSQSIRLVVSVFIIVFYIVLH